MKYEESANIELKETLTDDVKKEIIAFLNSKGGTIYVGVDDNGVIKASWNYEERDEMDVKISNWINDVFYPSVSNLVRYYFNDDGVLVIEIKEGSDKPYYSKEKGPKPSGVYKRIGTSAVKASESEILLMLLDSRKYNYEEDVSEEQELTFNSFNQICDEHNLSHDERNLRSLRMIDKEGKYTNLALWMSDQSPLVVKFAKYDKNLNFTTKKEYKGSLLKVLDNVLENAANYNDISAVIDGKSWERRETVSYPGASLREGIFNAFCHANYFLRSNVKIEFFEDKVKITNPGGIFQATLEQILDGVQTYRNPGLVNILDKLHYIENFGTGIPRILEAYKLSKKQPEFKPSDNFFILILPNQNYKETDNDTSIKASGKKLSDSEISLLKFISKNQGLNASEIQKSMQTYYSNLTIDMVKNSLKRKLSDFVEFRGAPKNGGYYLK